MLILLPPSEGKNEATKKKELNLSSLSFAPHLTAPRQEMISLHPEINSAYTDPAINIYSGVLYQALDYPSLTATEKRRADNKVLIISAVFGAVRPLDEICSYKAKIKPSLWKKPLSQALVEFDSPLIIDMRSSTYSTVWHPKPSSTVGIRVFTEVGGEKKVITHMSKKYRGEITRLLLTTKTPPETPQELAGIISQRYQASLIQSEGNKSWFIDVIVA
jgi:hypothetical protein